MSTPTHFTDTSTRQDLARAFPVSVVNKLPVRAHVIECAQKFDLPRSASGLPRGQELARARRARARRKVLRSQELPAARSCPQPGRKAKRPPRGGREKVTGPNVTSPQELFPNVTSPQAQNVTSPTRKPLSHKYIDHMLINNHCHIGAPWGGGG